MRAWKWCALVAGLSVAGSAATAAPLYDSGGFEAPRFTTSFVNPLDPAVIGNLRGQDAGVVEWQQAGPPGGGSAGQAVIQTAVKNGGAQAVRVDRGTADQRWAPAFSPAYNPGVQTVVVEWDMNVSPSGGNPANFGPFFGVEVYGGSGAQRIGNFGVDATTGEILFLDPVVGFQITPADTTVTLGTWNHYRMGVNYASKTYDIELNGVILATGIGFDTPAATLFSDADIAALQAAPGPQANQAGTAYFDNYQIYTLSTPIPLPPAVWMGIAAGVGVVVRRRWSKQVA